MRLFIGQSRFIEQSIDLHSNWKGGIWALDATYGMRGGNI